MTVVAFWTPLQLAPHDPQCWMSVRVFVSQPVFELPGVQWA
jgi:hypothetical protein